MPSKEYRDILELLDSMPDTSGLSFEEQRSNFEEQVSQLPVAESVSCEPVSAGGIPAEWIVPKGAPERNVLLYLHGGEFWGTSIGLLLAYSNSLNPSSTVIFRPRIRSGMYMKV